MLSGIAISEVVLSILREAVDKDSSLMVLSDAYVDIALEVH